MTRPMGAPPNLLIGPQQQYQQMVAKPVALKHLERQ